jgi:D-lyxose ketol-isomerase
MKHETNLSRRGMLGIAAAGLAAVFATENAEAQVIVPRANRRSERRGGLPTFKNEQFYKDGKFDAEAVKDAVLVLCRHHGYPVYPKLREQLWVSDYGLGKFTEVGLSCVGFANKLDGEHGEFSYMLQDLFLFPHQMLPEHWHVKSDNKKDGPQKDEGWIIRWGRSYVIGEGEPNLPAEVVVPASHGPVTVQHCTVADPGVFVPLSKRGSHHWQFAGSEGVILSEVANYHSNACVRHENKTANDDFLKGI